MKKTICYFALLVISIASVKSQDGERIFKRFKGDVSFGYATPPPGSSTGTSGGILFAMEPKFAIIDQLSVGLRMEGAVMAKFVNTGNGDLEVDNARAAASYLATIDYYFTNNYSFRPFIGGGAGVFNVASDYAANNYDYNNSNSEMKFGALARVGAEIRHFRFGIEYNFVPNSNVVDYNNTVTGVS